MIRQTNTTNSQWSIIEADDKKFATIKTLKIIINKIQEEVHRIESINQRPAPVQPHEDYEFDMPEVSILSSIDPSKNISEEHYKQKLDELQLKITNLEYKLYKKRRSVVIAFEGWDAAGKGGSIKRLTEEMDPRGYEVIPTAAPSKEELSHHYLWRFWKKMPKDGHIAIFDRTWYGRVTVERIENYVL